ncbi:MAG: isochorismatase family protein [bacterium]|nr:isochorismatase family protein [bacterium]
MEPMSLCRCIALFATVSVMAGVAAAAPANPPLKVCMVSGSFEYESDMCLASYKEHIEASYNAACTIVSANGWEDLPGLEALDDCDVALFFTRRLKIDGDQLQKIRDYCAAGEPIVGVRTASHGFQNWLEMDKDVLGGNYHNHYGKGRSYRARICKGQANHPILAGVSEIRSSHTLYKNTGIADDTTLLMTGRFPGQTEPVAWVREHNGGRVFYTSLGGQQEFQNGTFRRMLANALFWAAKRDVERLDLPPLPPMPPKPKGAITLPLRSRVETDGQWKDVVTDTALPVGETAIILCDMWDRHWCRGATERVDELAAKMAPLVNEARAKGIQIIHSPSDTLGFYVDAPQLRRTEALALVEPPADMERPDPPLPIDDSDGGCDTEGDKPYSAWSQQHPLIEIGEFDIISDNGRQVYSFLKQRGITNLIMMGVHTNMCVLNRSFAIKQMTRWGIDCVLVRDMTDAMYDPKDEPKVSHDEGTELVVRHIEQHWCPTTTSDDLFAALDAIEGQ